ncbi:hypothetical protein D9756_007520 [Leucocoprinus leucothites]|uniref:Carboxypeptidase n=1 Tax=Leucocoprinus leucothites TaxID=201217 RepID=A0A8H5FWH4_9AGAR|nr:hypothetical protein D9756_007520 [Leucoagaricus leucothites]
MRTLLSFSLLALASIPSVLGLGGAMEGLEEAMEMQKEQIERMRAMMDARVNAFDRRQGPPTDLPFKNPKARKFFVDGTKIPEVNFDAGPSWAGLLPISGAEHETRKLFFWFWPTANLDNANDLVFWTNGGPGCSSLEGFLQENGPISWSWGQAEPTPNPFSWTKLANVLWVEQPVGTGFTQGVANITNDDQLAEQLVGFLGQFLEVFDELKGSNFYLTGESYAGFYVPYIANWIYEHPGLPLDLKGIWIADPSLSSGTVQRDIPALRFAQANQNVFPFNSSFWAELQRISDDCGFTDYLDKFVTYPPNGPLPLVGTAPECRISRLIQRAVGVLNPAFNVYRVTDTFPNLWSVLGFPRDTQEFIYFNRTDVQDAIHAPHMEWSTCSDRNVYVRSDQSLPSMLSGVMPNVIENSERVVVVHGLADMILIAEGTRIAIQNMTWNGAQGFQTPIEPESFTVDGFGVFGHTHTERNLTYVEFFYSGHMTPQFVPWASFNTMSYLLGHQDSVST